jgi:DNA-directed RNA polymerase subunit omega
MEKKGKTHLTNEGMIEGYSSIFELVNYAIKLAENMIKTGRDARVKSDVQNRAMLILDEIREGKDYFDEIDDSSYREDGRGEFGNVSRQREGKNEERKYRTTEVV